MSATDDTIDDWVARELAAWQGSTLTRETVETRLGALEFDDPEVCVCLFRIEDGTVDFDPSVAIKHPYCLSAGTPLGRRAALFLTLLRDAVAMFDVEGAAIVGIHLNDLYCDGIDAPVFFFQKPRGTRGILLPDVDFLASGYYVDAGGDAYDVVPYAEKSPTAIFVGSTTGDLVLTSDHITHLRNARLRAAVYFRDHDPDRRLVTFHLPNIVQVDTEATRALIETLKVGGTRTGWPEQLRRRYVLSIDGNGATCSRVVHGLASNSVLVKYQSENELYYFHGLRPWRHYIPVHRDEDVIDVVDQAGDFGDLHESIARESRRFAHAYLSRVGVLRYTASLLSRYITLFGVGGGGTVTATDDLAIDSATHVDTVGTIWSEPGGWSGSASRGAITGFNLFPGPGLASETLLYRGVLEDGTMTELCRGRQFCGTRDEAKPLHGLSVALAKGTSPDLRITCRARFADGSSLAVDDGDPVPHETALTGFRIRIVRRRKRQQPG